MINVVFLHAQSYTIRAKGVPAEANNILVLKDTIKDLEHKYLYFKITNVDQTKKMTIATYNVDGMSKTMSFPNHQNFIINDFYGWMSIDKKWAIVYGSCEVLQPDNIINDPIYLANLSTGTACLISVDNRSLYASPTKNLKQPVSGFNAKSEYCISVDNKGIHGWEAVNCKEIWKMNLKDVKEVQQLPGTDYTCIIYQYKRAQEAIIIVQTSTGKKVYEHNTGSYYVSAYYDGPGNSLYFKCSMMSYCKKISMNTFSEERTFYNNIIPFNEISFYGGRKWVRFSDGEYNVLFNTQNGDRLNWSSKIINYNYFGANSNGEESIPFYASEYMIYNSDEFWIVLNKNTGHFIYENKYGNSLSKFTIYKDSVFETEINSSRSLYDKKLLSKGFTEDGKAVLVERMAKLCPKVVNSNFLYLLDPLMLETKERIVKAMKKNIAGWAFVDTPSENVTEPKSTKVTAKSYAAGTYCVPMVLQKVSTGINYSISYACIYAQVTTTSQHTRDEIVSAAKQVKLKEYGSKMNGYSDYDIMFFEKTCNDCKEMINAKYLLSDFQVIFTTLQ